MKTGDVVILIVGALAGYYALSHYQKTKSIV